MITNNPRLKTLSRAAVYGAMKHRHRVKRRHFIAGQTILVALVVALSTVLQVYFQVKPPTVKINERALGLLSESRDDAKDYLKQDAKTQGYAFEVPKSSGDTEASEHTGRVADSYSVNFGHSSKDGVSVTDTNTQIAFKMTPKFTTSTAHKTDDNRVVYTHGATQLVYTLQYNGLKEDIIVPEFQQDSLNYEFELSLPSGVEARLDEQGNIGIYSADTTLYGQISYGSDDDRARVDKARENGAKTNLVATIPYPIVKDASGKEHNDLSKFVLGNKQTSNIKDQKSNPDLPAEVATQMASKTIQNTYSLKIESKGLKDLPYPISIDPTFQISSASDFISVNREAGTEIDTTNNLIRRSSLSGGVLNTWTADNTGTSFGTARNQLASIAINGYVYVVGGYAGGSALTSVEYASISTSSCGTDCVGNWSAATAIPVGRNNVSLVYANGYLYAVGGDDGVNAIGSALYIKVNSNGSLGASWTATSTLTTARTKTAASYWNGRLYVAGGSSQNGGSTYYQTIEYATINADGTLAGWTQDNTNTFTTARQGLGSVIYNGYLYIMGGNDNANFYATVYYTRINSNGSINAWTQTTSMPGIRGGFGTYSADGYVYVTGGCQGGSCSALAADTVYAQINSDGTLGTWRTTTSFTNARWQAGTAFYNGYVFELGGCTNTSSPCTSYNNDAQYTSIKPAGELHNATWSSGTSISAGRETGSVAVNGYIYAIGGCNATNCETELSTVDYAALNANGSIGTWATTTGLPANLARAGITAYNGYIYVIGGCTTIVSNACTVEIGSTYYAAPTSTGTISAWSTDSTNPLNTNRNMFAATAYNGYVYVAGDYGGGASSDDVEYAQINTSDGSLNAWTAQTSALSSGKRGNTLTAYNGYLYVTGGRDTATGNPSTTVYYSLIGGSGVPGSFSTTSGMGTARDGHSVDISKGYIYAVSGDGLLAVEYAKVNSDGTLATWASTQSLGTSRFTGGGIIASGNFYAVAGWTGAAYTATTEYQHINNGGSGINDSSVQDTDKINARSHHGAVALNGYFYIIGGCIKTTSACTGFPGTNVQYAVIAANGTIGAFSSTTSLTVVRQQHATFVYNGRIFVVGGCTNTGCTTYTDVVESAVPNGGSITAWDQQDNGIGSNNAWVAFDLAAYDGYVYRVGGNLNGARSLGVQYASINAGTGAFGTWTTTTAIGTAIDFNQVVAYHGYLYTLGGATAASQVSTVEFAAIDSTAHTVGAWTSTTLFAVPRTAFTAEAHNGYMYIAAGYSVSGFPTENVQLAPILPNGQLGVWQKSANALVQYTNEGSGTIYDGRLYITGGNSATGNSQDDVEYMPLQSITRAGSFSRLYNFDVGVKPTKLITRGTKQRDALVALSHQTTNNTSPTLGSVSLNSNIGFAGANAVTFSLGSNVTISQYLLVRYSIDDTMSAVFPDSGNETTITDFDVYYRANSAKRLRGGKTFTNGINRGLDAQP